MATRGPRRPHSLIAQAQENLRTAQAAHRVQHLQLTLGTSKGDGFAASISGSGGPASSPSASSSQRPPQLPGTGAGYPSRSPTSSSSLSALELPTIGTKPSSPAAQRSSSRGAVIAKSPSSRPGSRHRTAREESPAATGAAAASSSRTGRRPSSASSRSSRGGTSPRGAADAEDDFAAELAELDEMCAHLHISVEDPASSCQPSDARPTTGGTSASGSTTAPAGSVSGELSMGADSDDWLNSGRTRDGGEDSGLRGVQRAQQELQNCKLPHGCRIERLVGSATQLIFEMDVSEGPFTPATLSFWVKVFDDFPAPGSFSVRSTKRLFHPSIDPTTCRVQIPEDRIEGGALALRPLLLAIRDLICNPLDSPAVNGDAAMLLQTDRDEFRRTVRLTLNGGDHGGIKFDRVLNLGNGKAGATLKHSGVLEKPVKDEVKVELMQLEVMKEDFKQQIACWQQEIAEEIDRVSREP